MASGDEPWDYRIPAWREFVGDCAGTPVDARCALKVCLAMHGSGQAFGARLGWTKFKTSAVRNGHQQMPRDGAELAERLFGIPAHWWLDSDGVKAWIAAHRPVVGPQTARELLRKARDSWQFPYDFAISCGMPAEWVQKVIDGKAKPGPEQRAKIQRQHGIPPEAWDQ